MYRIPPAADLLSQGDIFRGRFAFTFVEDPAAGIQIVRDDQVISSADVGDAWQNGSEVMLSNALVSDFAIILTQSCDAENIQRPPLDFVLIGAVLTLTGMAAGSRLLRYHHLPADAHAGLPESYVHFGLLALVDQPSLAAYKAARPLALELPYREDLGHRFGDFFSRIALP